MNDIGGTSSGSAASAAATPAAAAAEDSSSSATTSTMTMTMTNLTRKNKKPRLDECSSTGGECESSDGNNSNRSVIKPSEEEKEKDDGNGDDDDDMTVIDLVVGGYHYTTTKGILLGTSAALISSPSSSLVKNSEEKQTYFHTVLSGRWDNNNKGSSPTALSLSGSNEVDNDDCSKKNASIDIRRRRIEIPELDGRIFFYVLYYLQTGELPRRVGSKSYQSLLTEDGIGTLKEQTTYLGLDGLHRLCRFTGEAYKPDIFKGCLIYPGVGDYRFPKFDDLTAKSHTEYEDGPFKFSLKYSYNRQVDVMVTGKLHDPEFPYAGRVFVKTRPYLSRSEYTKTMDEKGIDDTFKELKAVVELEHEEFIEENNNFGVTKKDFSLRWNSPPRNYISVGDVLARVEDIDPELDLFWALVIGDMIEHFRLSQTWECESFSSLSSSSSDHHEPEEYTGVEFLFRSDSNFHGLNVEP